MKQIYGIDLAKEKFDINYVNKQDKEVHRILKNKYASIVKFLKGLPSDVLLCAEHTGAYGELLIFLANIMDVEICLISGYVIKHSLGLSKGKSDKLDAKRIREYGERFKDKLEATKIPGENLSELKELHTLRSQLVKERKMILCHEQIKQQKPYNSIIANRIAQKQILHLDQCIDDIEDEILNIIRLDKSLFDNFKLINSIKGVGPVTTCELIIKTENFIKIDTAKRASSFAGVCPFPNSTGKMVGKSKVSKMSDKKLKSLLHMCAKTAVQHNKEFKLYYDKKKQEGKPYYLIMNNVSNKLLRTIYAIIESRLPYDQNFICLDPRDIEKIGA
jgi:transposase